MIKYSKKFEKLKLKVYKLRKQLYEAEKDFMKECPHMYLDGSSAFPRGISFTDCSLCGCSSYYAGRENLL